MPRSQTRPRALNARQQAFVAAFARSGDRSAAARTAGYRDPGQAGLELMKRPDVRSAVAHRRAQTPGTAEAKAVRAEALKARTTAQGVLEELARVAFFDLADYAVSLPDGSLEIDAAAMAAAGDMAAVRELVQVVTTYPDGRVERRMGVKLADKRTALVRLKAMLDAMPKTDERERGQRDILYLRPAEIRRMQREAGVENPAWWAEAAEHSEQEDEMAEITETEQAQAWLAVAGMAEEPAGDCLEAEPSDCHRDDGARPDGDSHPALRAGRQSPEAAVDDVDARLAALEARKAKGAAEAEAWREQENQRLLEIGIKAEVRRQKEARWRAEDEERWRRRDEGWGD